MITVQMRYFAFVREQLGKSKESIQLAQGSTVEQALDFVLVATPRLMNAKSAMMVMVNQSYQPRDHVLADGDEVAIIPPVSGGSDGKRFLVTRNRARPTQRRGPGDRLTCRGRCHGTVPAKVTSAPRNRPPPALRACVDRAHLQLRESASITSAADWRNHGDFISVCQHVIAWLIGLIDHHHHGRLGVQQPG